MYFVLLLIKFIIKTTETNRKYLIRRKHLFCKKENYRSLIEFVFRVYRNKYLSFCI